ncbi:MAG TPA: hypothetical protein VE570_10550 [Thermoleophilaceae bacterium]|nr:hypothetical protein [Thermoleophilaceae bacterium]
MTGQAPSATATLEIDAQAASLTGALSSSFGRLEFSGWAELAAAIEEWRARIRADEPPENAPRREGTP